jgi:hypothetical protein
VLIRRPFITILKENGSSSKEIIKIDVLNDTTSNVKEGVKLAIIFF